MCTALGADTLRLNENCTTGPLYLQSWITNSGLKTYIKINISCLWCAPLWVWHLKAMKTALQNLSTCTTSQHWKLNMLLIIIINISCLWCAPLCRCWHLKTMKMVQQNLSTWVLSNKSRLQNLCYNKHSMPLMCTALGANTLRLNENHTKGPLYLQSWITNSGLETYIKTKHFMPLMCTTLGVTP